jgi:hypothetical protein
MSVQGNAGQNFMAMNMLWNVCRGRLPARIHVFWRLLDPM